MSHREIQREELYGPSPFPSLLAIALLVLPILATPLSAAGPLLAASGSVVQTSFVQTNVRTAGGATLFDFTETDTLTGTFSGTSVIHGQCVLRQSGQGTCTARERFTGTVNGQSGTVDFADVIHILDVTIGAATGSFAVIPGGSLSTVRGSGTFEGAGGVGTYSGRILVAP